MKNNLKVRLLIGSCVVIVGMLSFIQYYLVDNTYQLTKDKYYAEVSRGVGNIIKLPANELIEDKAQENIKQTAQLYVSRKLTKDKFLSLFKSKNDSILRDLANDLQKQFYQRPELRNVAYKSQYDQIILTYNKRIDTVLHNDNKAVVIWGKEFKADNAILFSSGSNKVIIGQTGPDDVNSIKIQVNRSQYIDVTSWKQEVYKRMAVIYLLAMLLILAVIVLFYLVFSAMIKQKKLAGIKTDFANNITHELKTPLTSVGLVLKSLDRPEVQDDKQKTAELLATLKRQHEKIQQTVDFVLESAMETNPEIHKQQTDIAAYLHDFIGNLRIADHILESNIIPATQALMTNTQLLDKILNNLVDNAAKYSPDGTVITIKGYPSGPSYLIEVADQGPGIASVYQGNLFDKFFRIPQDNKHTVKGLGLGLFLSRQTAMAIGGNLTLKRTSVAGCIFTLELVL